IPVNPYRLQLARRTTTLRSSKVCVVIGLPPYTTECVSALPPRKALLAQGFLHIKIERHLTRSDPNGFQHNLSESIGLPFSIFCTSRFLAGKMKYWFMPK